MRNIPLALCSVALIAITSSCGILGSRSSSTAPAAPATPAATNEPAAPATPATPAEAGAAAAAGESIAGFPDYPGATKTGTGNETKPTGIRETKVKFTTTEPFEKVKAYYQDLVTKGGWQVIKQQHKAGDSEWDLAQGTSAVDIDIESKFGGSIEISIERKDR